MRTLLPRGRRGDEGGGSWAGPIGTAEVVVEWDPLEAPIDSVDIQPKGYRTSGNEIRWHFNDLNPGPSDENGSISLYWLIPGFHR
ncbi:MAG: hypothetical protein IPK72_20125 [Candidatus Eisenbacteria bacterium]|nr:hypothetical protein [Candidatus Eisenbacteria bacterium]